MGVGGLTISRSRRPEQHICALLTLIAHALHARTNAFCVMYFIAGSVRRSMCITALRQNRQVVMSDRAE